MPKINPFEPQSPITPGMFTGRYEEIIRLEKYLFQTKCDQPSNFMITGERGIGKSSLLLYDKFIATGKIPVDDMKFNFLVIDIDIDQNTTQLALIKKIELGLRSELEQTEKTRTFFSEAWGFLQRLEVGGVKINPKNEQKSDETVFDEFTYAFAKTVARITTLKDDSVINSSYDGVLILIDESDKASEDLQLGSFLKLLSERLQRRGCNKVSIGLAGLPELRQVLLKSHESSLRVFNELPLEKLSESEVNNVIDKCINKANEINSTATTITDEGRGYLYFFSEGYPHFIQQFGYSAFETDKDNNIDINDVISGALGENGALELIGERYYRNDFYNRIQQENYRQVLRIMADNLSGWITKKEIREKYKGDTNSLNNALQALRERKIILAKEGVRGTYRLQHKPFALWIKFKTTDPSQLINVLEKDKAEANKILEMKK